MSEPGAVVGRRGGGGKNGESWSSGGDGDIRVGTLNIGREQAHSPAESRGHVELVSGQTSRLQAVGKTICKGWEEKS